MRFWRLPLWYWEAFLNMLTQREFIKFPGDGGSGNVTYTRMCAFSSPEPPWRPWFEVLDFRTSGHFQCNRVTYSCPSGNDCNFRWFKTFKRESSNLLVNRKSPEVLKSIARTSNPLSAGPPGPLAQGPRRLWGREWYVRRIGNSFRVLRP